LEDRTVPTAGFSVFAGVLTITGNGGADRVEIEDGGRSDLIRIRLNGESSWTNIGSNVTEIRVNTNGGADYVWYRLTGDSREYRKVTADLGSGNDGFYAYFHDSAGPSHLRPGADVRVIAEGGDGNDVLWADVSRGTAINSFGCLLIDYTGEDGADWIGVSYRGELDGALFLRTDGNSGQDHVGADLMCYGGSTGDLAGTAGEVGRRDLPARVRGGDGDDQLAFLVRDYGAVRVFAQMQGGGGFDEGERTVNVVPVGIDVDYVVG
jgi:hypothetical protein